MSQSIAGKSVSFDDIEYQFEIILPFSQWQVQVHTFMYVCERDRDYISKENFPQILIYPSLTFFFKFYQRSEIIFHRTIVIVITIIEGKPLNDGQMK